MHFNLFGKSLILLFSCDSAGSLATNEGWITDYKGEKKHALFCEVFVLVASVIGEFIERRLNENVDI